MSDESEDKKEKPLDPFDPEVIARSNRAILVGLQRQDDTAAEAQALLDELHELVSNFLPDIDVHNWMVVMVSNMIAFK